MSFGAGMELSKLAKASLEPLNKLRLEVATPDARESRGSHFVTQQCWRL